jgi:hypothetical protein
MKRSIPLLLFALVTLLAGCGDSQESFVVAPGGGSGSSLPVARADAYSTALNAVLAVPADTGVLANDTLNAVAGSTVTVVFPSVSSQGGQITSSDDNGAFTYTPAPGFEGTDGFEYELSNGFGTSHATVTIEVALGTPGAGFFVDSVSGNDASGDFQSGSPFATVQAAVTAAGPGQDIVVYPGRGTYTGTVNLLDGQRLLGFASALVQAQGTDRPTLSGPVVLADGNTVDSIRVVRTAGIGIDGDDQTGGTVTNCEVADTEEGATGIQIRDITGNWLIEGNTVTRAGGIGIDMDTQDDGSGVVRVNHNDISGCRLFGLGMAAFGQSELTVQVNDNVLADNLGLFSVLAISAGTSTLNMEILDNQNDSAYRFDRLTSQAALNVERFSDFESQNTVMVPDEPVTDVPADSYEF